MFTSSCYNNSKCHNLPLTFRTLLTFKISRSPHMRNNTHNSIKSRISFLRPCSNTMHSNNIRLNSSTKPLNNNLYPCNKWPNTISRILHSSLRRCTLILFCLLRLIFPKTEHRTPSNNPQLLNNSNYNIPLLSRINSCCHLPYKRANKRMLSPQKNRIKESSK